MSRKSGLTRRLALALGVVAPLACGGTPPPQGRAKAPANAGDADALDERDELDAPDDEEPVAVPAPVGVKGMEIDFTADPRPPEGDMVFFSSYGGALAPIGCYDAATKSVAGGDACLERAPAGAEVFVSGLEMSGIGRLGDRVKGTCDKIGAPPDAFALVGDAPPYDWGTWPKSGTMQVVQTLPGDLGPKNRDPAPEELELVTALLQRAGAPIKKLLKQGATIAIQQDYTLDLNGDHEHERIWSLTVRPADASTSARQFAWTGFLVTPEADPSRVTVIDAATDDESIFLMRGTVDLKGTKKLLLWMLRLKGDATGDRLVELDAKPPRALSGWMCPVD